MHGHQNQKPDPRRPDQFIIALEKMAVAIDGLRTQENLQVAHQVADDENKQQESRHRHQVLLAQRRFEYVRNYLHETKNPAPEGADAGCAIKGIYWSAASGQEPKLIFSLPHNRSNHNL